MANWRDRLQPGGKFRGVPFFVTSVELAGGRRNVLHEYPFNDDPAYVEDTGRKNHSFPVEAYVIGDEYIAARDNLLTALDATGYGELVHPYYGTKRVVVDAFRIQESASEGGWAKLTISFIETVAGPSQPKATATASAVTASASAAKDSVGAEFFAVYDQAASLRASIVGAIRAAIGAVSAAAAKVSMDAQTTATLQQQLTSAADSVDSLVGSAQSVFDTQLGIVEALAASLLTSAVPNPSAVMLALYGFDPGQRPVATTPNRAAEQANFDATQYLFQRLVLVQSALLAIEQTFPSYETAVATRVAITDLMDDQVETASDDTYPSLVQLRTDLVNAVPGDAADLPHLLTYTPRATVPSLVLAHQLYGDVSKEADIVARNNVSNPGFVPAGEPLEILSSD